MAAVGVEKVKCCAAVGEPPVDSCKAEAAVQCIGGVKERALVAPGRGVLLDGAAHGVAGHDWGVEGEVWQRLVG